MDRQNWVTWTKGGAQSMDDRIRTRLHKILATHRPKPLPDGAAEKIQAVLDAAEARHAREGAR
jgi:trimethylamine:corrinoid methyltransferase-like protein